LWRGLTSIPTTLFSQRKPADAVVLWGSGEMGHRYIIGIAGEMMR
jgi:hypothetical protein